MSNFQSWLDEYLGARWVRVDFHLHTPSVSSFRCPSGLDPNQHREKIVQQYVQKLVDENINIAAIADYNGIREEWFVPIRDEASRQGIVVFPGAELDFQEGKYGLHIVVVFPPDIDIQRINTAIQALDKNAGNPLFDEDGCHRSIEPRESTEKLLSDVRRQFEAILIVPHPNNDKGLFTTFDAERAAGFLSGIHPDAIENLNKKDKNRLISTGILKKDYFQRLASVEFSDPKGIEEIGSKIRSDNRKRTTYLKLSAVNDLNAIRLALHDPDVRVCTGEAPQLNYTHLLAVEVEGSGFLGSRRLILSPELNALIGGRGVGKSAVLEVIRYALDLEPYAPTEYREGLVQHALGSGGKVSLYLEQVINSQVRRTYRIERIWGEKTRVFELNPEREVELLPQDVLGDKELPLFFGQREIYEVMRNERQRLRLLDEIIGRTSKKNQQEMHKLEEELQRTARDLLDLERKLTEKEEIEHRLKEIEHEIEVYRREGLVEKLGGATLLAQDEERLNQMTVALNQVDNFWHEAVDKIKVSLQQAQNQAKHAKSANKAILEEAADETERLLQNFDGLFQQGEVYLKQSHACLDSLMEQWKKKRQPLDEEIQRIKQGLGTQKLDPDHLDELTREQTRLQREMEILQSVEKQKDEKQNQRKTLLRKFREIQHQVFQAREKQAQELSERLGRVRIHVEYKGQEDEFISSITAILQGSSVDKKTIEKLCLVEDRVIDGQDIAEAVREGVEKLQEEFNLTPARANQVYIWFQDQSRLFELELLFPDDQVQVFLRLDDSELPLEKLSDGQRAAAMLLLLLTQEERILIVDQPEDDLDNRFIYEDIVQILRKQKGTRQIIVATHNPNIPVLGDAELIVVLEASERKAYVREQGAVDGTPVREAVKKIMEGGERAFRRRAEKYGWLVEGGKAS